MTIGADEMQMLRNAARSDGLSVSELAERAIRAWCIDYLPQTIEVTALDNKGVSIAIYRRGEAFFSRRAARRDQNVGVRGVVDVHVPGKIKPDELARTLRSRTIGPADQVRRERPLAMKLDGNRVVLKDFTLEAERDPAILTGLLRAAADAIQDSPITSVRDVLQRRCPVCDYFMVRLAIWSAPDRPVSEQETEWRCGRGHTSQTSRSD